WEGRDVEVIHPSIGWMQVEEFDPAEWKPNWPNEAFRNLTSRDGYWAAKLVGAFTDEQIRAAVGAVRLRDSSVADTLVDILAYRRDRIVEHWYGEVTPIEEVEIVPMAEGLEVRFTDAGIEAGVWDGTETRYRFQFEDPARGIVSRGSRAAVARRSGQRLLIPFDAATRGEPDEDALSTLRVTAERPGATGRPSTLFLAWRAGRYRIVGLEH
ncbi:MAG: hypothetical protein ACRELC_02855, partial [Gemmatimonadota bacterium]